MFSRDLKKILNSKVLWLCDLTDSNDDQKVVRTFKILWNGVKVRLRESDLPCEVLEPLLEITDTQYEVEIKSDLPYGVCFCEKEDLLYQWKEYGDNTKGVSIGFDLNWFIRNGIRQQKPHPSSIQSNAIGCDGVIYHSDEFEKQMANLCYQAIQADGAASWILDIRPTFKHYSGFVKNPSFSEEHEIRIVYYPTKGMEFSTKDEDISELKTYGKEHYEISWVKGGEQALKPVCIGHNCSLTEKDIRKMLKENGLNREVQISGSQCSYRLRE